MRRLTTQEFIEKCRSVHGDKYDYSKVEYKNSTSKITIVCKEHGEFSQIPSSHLSGVGCRECGIKSSVKKKTISQEHFIERCLEVHGNRYDYSKAVYRGGKKTVNIICKKHGEFEQLAAEHIKGANCPKCSYEDRGIAKRGSLEDFLSKSKKIHCDKYDYSSVEYITAFDKVNIICPEHGVFEQLPNGHLSGRGCSKCSKNSSDLQKEIYSFIKNLVYCEENNSEVLEGKELDIYIPSLKVGIEVNGLYWHSDLFKKNDYHLCKTEECMENGIRLIQIFEDEWFLKKDIVKSRILNILNKTDNIIYARKCEIKEVDSKECREFLMRNHIQGNVNSRVRLGLFYGNEMVSLMTFGNLRKNLGQVSEENVYELLRFCNKLNTSVVGGASRLFKHFLLKYSPNKVISYADRRWSVGNLYEKLGFSFKHNSDPNYYYVSGSSFKVRENRFKYRKSELVKEGFDSTKTEKEIMKERGYFRVYDCGNIRYEYECY